MLLCLGSFAWDQALRLDPIRPKPRFGHGAVAQGERYVLLGSFHVSQQNTFTGKPPPGMLDDVLVRARALAEEPFA